MMKKCLLAILILALFSLVACNIPADVEDVPVCADTVSADIGSVSTDMDDTLVDTESTGGPRRGGRFCAAHLPEDEVLRVYSSSGDRIIFDDMDDMLSFVAGLGGFREYVVRVEVLDERVEWVNTALPSQAEGAYPFHPDGGYPDEYMPRTIYRVQVLDVFKGEVEVGDILEVGQSGGQIDNVHFVADHAISLPLGGDLVLFLSIPSWMSNEDWSLGIMGGFQGAYRFPDIGDGMRAFSLDEDLASVYQFPEHMEHFAFDLTLGDLVEFTIENFGYEAAMAIEWVDAAELQEYLARR